MILTALSLLILILSFVEVVSEIQVSRLTDAVGLHEANISAAQSQQEVLKQMLQRLALASLTDPAVADVLHKRGMRVNHVEQPPGTSATLPAGSKPASPPPEVPPVAQ